MGIFLIFENQFLKKFCEFASCLMGSAKSWHELGGIKRENEWFNIWFGFARNKRLIIVICLTD